MQNLVTAQEMKAADKRTSEQFGIDSLVLMERAALSAKEILSKQFPRANRFLFFCGVGNNGGDGLAIARLLHLQGIRTWYYVAGKEERMTAETAGQLRTAEYYQVPRVHNLKPDEYTTIVDAIFGVGLDREVGGSYKEKIKEINQADAKVVAVDIPSGIDSATGKVLGCAVCADWTVSFAYEKLGTVFYEGAEYAGNVRVTDIGIVKMPEICFPISTYTFEEKDLKEKLFRRESGNKGTFGKVLLIAGIR